MRACNIPSRHARCPVCRYSLRGLPPAHRCPECGFAYDEQTAIWRPAHPWKGHGPLLFVNIFLAVTVSIGPARRWVSGARLEGWEPLLATVAVVSTAFSVLHIRSTNKKGRCVVVSPAGVFVRTAEAEKTIPWGEIAAVERVDRRVKEERDEYVVKIRINSSNRGVEVDKIFSSEGERTSFIEAVEARLRMDRQVTGGG